jgi:CYTH domain-containing protein
MAQKYSLPELERRWLVREEAAPMLASIPRRIIEDKYIQGGRLRLRAVFSEGAEPVYKLGKKYGREGSGPEQVVSTYLSEQEYESLLVLPGAKLRKVRYSVEGGSLDVLEYPSPGLVIFEVEFPSQGAASAYVAPSFVGEEVTFSANYTGHALAHRAL